MKTPQERLELVNRVSEHLLAQNKKSVNFWGSCLYRGPDGLKCAIGALLPDDTDFIRLENLPVSDPAVLAVLGVDVNDMETIGLLTQLQKMHDNGPIDTWAEGLTLIADNLALIIADLGE